MIIIGHRGARFEAPENTVPGFRYAIDLELGAVEFDIRMTRDDQLVVIHDATVDRTTNGQGEVASFTLEQLQSLDARSIFPDWPEPCVVPTFGEVLDVVQILPELFVEIKGDTPVRLDTIVPATIAEILRRDIADRVTITSFDPYALEVARRVAPEIRRGLIGDWDTQQFLDRAVALDCAQADARHATADPGLIAKVRSLGMRVIGWPTNSQEDLDSVLAMGPQLFCTDNPTLLIELYGNVSKETA
jgi:glycerophosphoryl diester phosphodiesterase